MLNGLTAAQSLLIILVLLTALGLGGAFVGVVLFFNKRLNDEQRRAEWSEEQRTGHSGGSGARPDAPPIGRDFTPMAQMLDEDDDETTGELLHR